MDEMQDVLEKIGHVSEEFTVDRVFGKPHTLEGRTIIPVAEIAYGYGAGFGSAPTPHECECECECDGECEESDAETCDCCCHDEEEDEDVAFGGGGGGGGMARPIAYIEVTAEGVRVQPIIDEQRVALAGIVLTAWIFGWVGLVLKTIFSRQ